MVLSECATRAKSALVVLAAVLLLAGCGHAKEPGQPSASPPVVGLGWTEVSSAGGPLTAGRWSYGPPFHIDGGVVRLSGRVSTSTSRFTFGLGLTRGLKPRADGRPQIAVGDGLVSGPTGGSGFELVDRTTDEPLPPGIYRIAVTGGTAHSERYTMTASVAK
jgi:hypothetical protein